MAGKRKTYAAKFKQEAVRLGTEHRYGMTATTRNLGLHVHMLRRWQQACTAHPQAAFPGNGRRTAAQEELRQLRDEVQR